eukprot:TRINITY_DN22481_c0_g1_i1.p1 TRINITY_DN22481_c0_g1~~TRINITY_DN22481_c0_g1_i1.p1  ORF type:complete len:204 (-),score=28.94 TRINITY_DN22481_c0_g1_i1:66-677(-)
MCIRDRCYIEALFAKPGFLSYIVFQNFYTYSITVKQGFLASETSSTYTWKTVLRNYKLMKNPHFEGDAQDWHIIKTEQFNSKYDRKNLKVLRIFLIQPSPNWVNFTIRNLSCFSIKLLQSMIDYDLEGRHEEKLKARDFASIKSKFQANYKSLAAFSTTEISKYSEKIGKEEEIKRISFIQHCLLYTSPSPRDLSTSRMPSSA